jgi:hypothetical protein
VNCVKNGGNNAKIYNKKSIFTIKKQKKKNARVQSGPPERMPSLKAVRSTSGLRNRGKKRVFVYEMGVFRYKKS